MKKSGPPAYSEHQDTLLLPYLENMLTPEERATVEEHIRSCQECRSRLQGIDHIIAALRHNKDAFCPEPWELHEFVHNGRDPEGTIAKHLEICGSCREDAQAVGAAVPGEAMPSELWSQLRERLPKPPRRKTQPTTEARPVGLLERLNWLFRSPAIVAGAVATAVLLVVLLYPQEMTQPQVGLSSITWEGALKPKALQNRAAIILLFKDFKHPVPQKKIDSIYRALEPSMDLSEHYHIVSPAELRAAVTTKKINLHDSTQMLGDLRKRLDVSKAVVVTIIPAGERLNTKVELLDTNTGNILETKTDEGVTGTELDAKVRSSVLSVLLPHEKRKKF